MTAWTAPKTFLAGTPLTAAELNEQLRDNTLHLKEGVTTLEPKVTAVENALTDGSSGLLAVKDYVDDRFIGAVVSRTGDQSVPTNTTTDITWSLGTTGTYQKDVDLTSAWSSGSGTRLTIPSSLNGRYAILGAQLSWQSGSGGRRAVSIARGGNPLARNEQGLSGGAYVFSQQVQTFPILLATGQYFTVQAYHTQGSSLNVLGGSNLLGSSGQVSRFWLKVL